MTLTKVEPEWQQARRLWGHSLHPMCSYMAMFPAALPHYFIDRFTDLGDTVLDPFSGRGTTATQAGAEGRIGIGNDLNPLAVALTEAKVRAPEPEVARMRIEELRGQYSEWEGADTPVPEDIAMLFHPRTLRELQFLGNVLNASDLDVDRFLCGVVLGALHGNSPTYLSLPMPNTFSMSPGYIRNYVAKHNLVAPERDVFGIMLIRAARLLAHGPLLAHGHALSGDVRTLPERFAALQQVDRAVAPVRLVFSSPPYMKVVKYGLYNWIRLWFLGVQSSDVDALLDDEHDLAPYLDFMSAAEQAVEAVLATDATVVWVIGDVVRGGKPVVNLAEAVWGRIESETAMRLVDIVTDDIPANKKVTRIWSEEKRGRATPTDRLLILQRGSPPDHGQVSWVWPPGAASQERLL